VKVEWEDSLDVIYNKGAVRLVKTEGTGPALEEGGAVSFYYAGYVFTSNPSSLFATNHQETAAGAGFILTDDDYQIFEADMRSTQLLEGVRNGLIGVKSGEVCEIAFSGKYGFGDEVFGTIPVNSALLYKIWVLGVSNE
jgi:FKBP-type peptidyl-prolyl cis-trans isomerase